MYCDPHRDERHLDPLFLVVLALGFILVVLALSFGLGPSLASVRKYLDDAKLKPSCGCWLAVGLWTGWPLVYAIVLTF